MYSKWVKPLILGGAIVSLSAATSFGVTMELKDASGTSSGWQATIPDALASDVTLSFVRSAGGTFFFNENVNYSSVDQPVMVEFHKLAPTASTLSVATENVSNGTGQDWSGYRFFLGTGTDVGGTPLFAIGTSDGSAGLGSFSIDPFTQFKFTNSNTELDVNGGTVANGTTWKPGSATGTGLSFIASGASASDFLFKQIPMSGNNPGPGPGPGPSPVPLPAAAWTGLSTLLGLGALGSLRRLRRIS